MPFKSNPTDQKYNVFMGSSDLNYGVLCVYISSFSLLQLSQAEVATESSFHILLCHDFYTYPNNMHMAFGLFSIVFGTN